MTIEVRPADLATAAAALDQLGREVREARRAYLLVARPVADRQHELSEAVLDAAWRSGVDGMALESLAGALAVAAVELALQDRGLVAP